MNTMTSRSSAQVGARVANLINGLRVRKARYSVYRTTVRELDALSERELADLGIHRSAIRAIAYQAAYEG